jgi:phytoene/squalene synthetase
MANINFHAVMIDETGCEFGASVSAASYDEAYDKLRDNYPESSVAQLESPEDMAKREREIYAWVNEHDDWDDYGDDDDDDDY